MKQKPQRKPCQTCARMRARLKRVFRIPERTKK